MWKMDLIQVIFRLISCHSKEIMFPSMSQNLLHKLEKKMPDHLVVLRGDESLLLFVHIAHLGESFLEPSNLLFFLLYRPAHRVEFRVAEARFRGRCHSTVLKLSNYLWIESLPSCLLTAEKFIFPPFFSFHFSPSPLEIVWWKWKRKDSSAIKGQDEVWINSKMCNFFTKSCVFLKNNLWKCDIQSLLRF